MEVRFFSNYIISVLSNDDSVYSYDGRQRLRRKKLPGIEAEEYVYDNYERLALSRDITSITYNALNLPETITFTNGSTVTYQYAADGTRLSESTYEKKENGMGATLSSETATDILSSDLNPIGPITHIEPGEELGTTNDTYYAGSYEFGSFGKPQRLLLGGGYLTLSDNVYHHYITDYQGDVVLVINTGDRSIEQQTGYYPYGMPHGDAVGADVQPNKYSGKRLQTFAGMDTYDFHARQLPIGIPRFDRPDPMAENFRQLGLYTYCGGDPVNATDPTGCLIRISGKNKEEVLSQLNIGLGIDLGLYIDSQGYIKSVFNGDRGNLSSLQQNVLNAIERKDMIIKLVSTENDNTASGKHLVGGAFFGTQLIDNSEGTKTVVVTQYINIKILSLMSEGHGKPGADMLHELTEAYAAGLLTLSGNEEIGIPSNPKDSQFQTIHNMASPQSGEIRLQFLDKNGEPTEETTDTFFYFIRDANGKQLKIWPLD